MKILKNTEGNNEEQLKATKDQGEKQLHVIKEQKKNQMKVIKKDNEIKNIVYLRKGIHKLLRMYPKYFNQISRSLLENQTKNEYKIDYKF